MLIRRLVLQSGRDGESTRLPYPDPVDNQQKIVISVEGDPTFMHNTVRMSDAQPALPSIKYILKEGSPGPEVEFRIYQLKELNETKYTEEFQVTSSPPGITRYEPVGVWHVANCFQGLDFYCDSCLNLFWLTQCLHSGSNHFPWTTMSFSIRDARLNVSPASLPLCNTWTWISVTFEQAQVKLHVLNSI
jgi:hypothetical protein